MVIAFCFEFYFQNIIFLLQLWTLHFIANFHSICIITGRTYFRWNVAVLDKLNRNYPVFFFILLQDRATPIFIAAQNGHRTVLLTLLTEGGKPNVCRIDGASPLWIASQMGHDHIVRVLLKNGAHVDAVRCVSGQNSRELLFILKKKFNFQIMFSVNFVDRMAPLHYSKQRTKDFRQS